MDKDKEKSRTENPGVRTQSRSSTAPNKDVDQPWISNYPPLHDWLMINDARCDWQLRYGKGKAGFMLEQWRMPGSLPIVVLVYAGRSGWEIFTPNNSSNIRLTLADAKRRAYPYVNTAGLSSLVQCPTCEGKCQLDEAVDCKTCGNDGLVLR